MDNVTKKKHHDRSGQAEGGAILLGFGVLFLLINLDILPGLGDSWPVILIIVGLSLIIGGFIKKKQTEES
jgi:hypothetical protein